MQNFRWTYLLLTLALVFSLGLAACGGEDADEDDDNAPAPVTTQAPAEGTADTALVGDAGRGETLFGDNGCGGCHAVTSEDVIAGPALKNVADTAATRVEGMGAEEYLRQSMVDPQAHVVEGFETQMPSYAQLPEQDITDLVAYLMTLDE